MDQWVEYHTSGKAPAGMPASIYIYIHLSTPLPLGQRAKPTDQWVEYHTSGKSPAGIPATYICIYVCHAHLRPAMWSMRELHVCAGIFLFVWHDLRPRQFCSRRGHPSCSAATEHFDG